MEVRFTKIKYDGSKVRIDYEVERKDGGDPDEYTLFCADTPARSFVAAMDALTQDVVTICELAQGDAAQITVRGVTLTWAHGIMGACITAMKALKTANAPLVLNTPHIPSDAYGPTAGGPILDPSTVTRLRTLADEAQKYVDGERAQADLFAEAAVLDSVAALGGIDGITSVTISTPGAAPVVIDSETAQAAKSKAKALRQQTAH